MNKLTTSTPLGTLGLASGDHWVKFHVEGDAISFEVAASLPAQLSESLPKKPTGFVQTWGGSARRITDPNDAWLSHINDKHLRGS
jgi:hypothetical protein